MKTNAARLNAHIIAGILLMGQCATVRQESIWLPIRLPALMNIHATSGALAPKNAFVTTQDTTVSATPDIS